MSTLFWCEAIDEQGTLVHAPDCDQHQRFVVKGKKQELNTGSKQKIPDHHAPSLRLLWAPQAL